MTDPRTKVILLFVLAAAHVVAGSVTVWTVLLPALGAIMLLYRDVAWRLRNVLLITLILAASICAAVSLTVPPATALGITSELARLCSLTVMTLVLVLSVSVLELAAVLRWFRLPSGVVLAFAVGMRFIPTVVEELQRISLVRRQRGLSFRQMVRHFNIAGAFSRALSPLIVSMIRRVDSIIMAVHVRRFMERMDTYRFQHMSVSDGLAMALAMAALSATIAERLLINR